MLKLILLGSIRYLMVSRDRVDGLQLITLSASGQQKPQIQGSYKEHHLGKELGLELSTQLPSHSNPNLPCPTPARHSPPPHVQSHLPACLRGKSARTLAGWQ